MRKIFLSDYIKSDIRTLNGRVRGEQLRLKLGIDQLQNEPFTVVFPESIESVTPSFIFGFFLPEFIKAGSQENFSDRIKLDCVDYLEKDIFHALDIASKMDNDTILLFH